MNCSATSGRMMASAMAAVSSGETEGSPSNLRRSPWTRMRGGEPTLMCRSEPSVSARTRSSRSSHSWAMALVSAGRRARLRAWLLFARGAAPGHRGGQRAALRVAGDGPGRRSPGPVPARLPRLGLVLAPPSARAGPGRLPRRGPLPAGISPHRGPRRRPLPDRGPGGRRLRPPRRPGRRRPGRTRGPRLGGADQLRGRRPGPRAVAAGGRHGRAPGPGRRLRLLLLRPAAAQLVHVLLPAPPGRGGRGPGRPGLHRPALGRLVPRLPGGPGARGGPLHPPRAARGRRRPRRRVRDRGMSAPRPGLAELAPDRLPDGVLAVVRRSCPTCSLVAPVLAQLAGAGVGLTVWVQDDPSFPAGVAGVVDDTGLELSYRLGVTTVPTLVRVEGGREVERLEGWDRAGWE